jgi:hypothetical protein
MSSGTWRAAVVGAVLGLVFVTALVAVFALGVFPTGAGRRTPTDGPVLVALVLPDASGSLTLRAVDRYELGGGSMTISAIDPLASATVAGTSATTLAEAYAFGGGDGLVAAYAENTTQTAPGWVTVGPESWRTLMGSRQVRLQLKTPIEVFDGKDLYSYPASSTAVPAAEIPYLMNGAAYLSDGERKEIRAAVGDSLATQLLRRYAAADTGIVTNLTPEQLSARLGGVKSPPVRADIER